MTNPAHIIGFGAGLVSALLFLSISGGTEAELVPTFLNALVVIYLSALPVYIASFGWGLTSGVVAAATSSLAISFLFGPSFGALFGLMFAAPAVILSYLMSLRREVPVGDGAARGMGGHQTPVFEWYPIGRVILWMAALAGTSSVMMVYVIGPDQESYIRSITNLVEKSFHEPWETQGNKKISDEQRKANYAIAVAAFPGVLATGWFIVTLFYMWLGLKVAEVSGQLVRPSWGFVEMHFPGSVGLMFLGIVAVTAVPGMVGLGASAYVAAMVLAFWILGLAVSFKILPESPAKPFAFYLLFLTASVIAWVGMIVALIGLTDPIFRLRERFGSSSDE